MSAILDPKDPADKVDYGIDWSAILTADGGLTIASSSWSLSDPAGLTILSDPAPSNTTTTTSVWVSGGTANTDYAVTNTITTSAVARIHQRTIIIPVRER